GSLRTRGKAETLTAGSARSRGKAQRRRYPLPDRLAEHRTVRRWTLRIGRGDGWRRGAGRLPGCGDAEGFLRDETAEHADAGGVLRHGVLLGRPVVEQAARHRRALAVGRPARRPLVGASSA